MSVKADMIFIVEDEAQMPSSSRFNIHRETYNPNFTTSDENRTSVLEDTKFGMSTADKVSLGLRLASLPFTPLAIAGGTVTALGLANLFNETTSLSEDDKIRKRVAEDELHRFLVNHAMTTEIARSLGCRFPPGHPRAGANYRLHPLADHGDDSKASVYIPEDKYDELLFEEREAELIKFLVNLGATRILITQSESTNDQRSVSGDVSAGNSLVEGTASAGVGDNRSSSRSWDREFVLSPDQSKLKPIQQEDYAWVNFEPSWQSILVAREVGGCTKASIVLKEETAFSTTKTASLQLANKAIKAGASGTVEAEASSSKSVLINVEFCALNE